MAYLMKGHTFKEHGHKMTYPCWVEIKIDEIRLHVQRMAGQEQIAMVSYAGKPLYNLDKYAVGLRDWMDNFLVRSLDMGVIVNGNFADTYRYVRSKKGVPEDLKNAHVQFILFDLPDLQGQRFGDRKITRHHIQSDARSWGLDVVEPVAALCQSAAEVHSLYAAAREAGHEGIMVKSLDHTYEIGKRIYGWLKYKPEEDADGIIVALHEAVAGKDQPELGIKKGDRLGRVGSVTVSVVPSGDGAVQDAGGAGITAGATSGTNQSEVTATPHGIPHDLGRDMLLHPDKYLGQWCEFRYMERDRQGGYRHPTFHRLREEKQ